MFDLLCNLAREVERWQEEVEDVVEEVDSAGVAGVGLGEGERKSVFFVWISKSALITKRRMSCGSF